MFPLPIVFVIFMLIILVAVALAACVLYALFLNWILKTPARLYLISSSIIGISSFLCTVMVLLYTLPPLRCSKYRATGFADDGVGPFGNCFRRGCARLY